MIDPTKPYRANNILKKVNTNNKTIPNSVKTGYIDVTVNDAITKEPIENAIINILELRISGVYHERGFGDIIITTTTDSNGEAKGIEIPANYESEEIIESAHEHIDYYMSITAESYHSIIVTNILIYPDVTNIYRINMTPTSLQRPQYEFIITPIIP